MATRSPRLDGGASSPFPTHPVRSSSFSSDVISTRSTGPAPTVPYANPSPAYVASSEADDLLSTELTRTVHVSPAALTLLNEFLDHVLYCIICTSHSLSLGQLKTAVSVVLKPRLGKSALKVAEEELKDYIEDDEAEELYSNKNNLQAKLTFDADLVWKLARLRCMVYARMGHLEEEDEEEWLEKEGLLDQTSALPANIRLSMAVTPGAAIFLTSVVEYLGEQALYYAAQYAQKRHDAASRSDNTTKFSQSQLVNDSSDIFLDGRDMNHVGRDSPLSRLWRSWRRNTRSSAEASSRPMSPEDALPPVLPSIRSQSPDERYTYQQGLLTQKQRYTSNHFVPASSRMQPPIIENELDEARERSLVTDGEVPDKETRRPLSMPTMTKKVAEDDLSPIREAPDFLERSPLRPSIARQRSNSLPTRQILAARHNEPIMPIRRNDSQDPRDGPTPTQETINSLGKQTFVVPSDQSRTDVSILSGNLPVVGVHHIQQRQDLPPLNIDTSNQRAESQSKSSGQPLTSASITGPHDFDTMYIPEGRPSPEGREEEQPAAMPVVQVSGKTVDPYQELAARQLEEHRRYSQQSHEMNTPSIYTNHEHSPRFRRDSPPFRSTVERHSKLKEEFERPSSSAPEVAAAKALSSPIPPQDSGRVADPSAPTPEPQRGTVSHAVSPEQGRRTAQDAPSSYAPTPEPGLIYDEYGNYNHGAANGHVQSSYRQTDSPVSQMSGKHPNRRYYPTDEPVPELPAARLDRQVELQTAPATHTSSHSKSSSSSSRLLGFTRDTSGKPHSIYQQSATGGMTNDVRRAHSSTPDKEEFPEIDQHTTSPKRNHLRIRADSENNVANTPSDTYDTERSLEHLIQGNETLHYTLTPASANAPEEHPNPSTKRTPTQDLADFFRNTAPPGQENTALPSTRSRKASMNATRAPQVLPVSRGPVPSSNGVVSDKMPKSKSKNPLGEPRDAKVDRMSGVRDLADYARSTGPSNSDQLPKAVVSGLVTPSTDRPVEMAAPNSPTDRSKTPRPQSRLKFQARDPRPSRHAESTDLMDFIRQGPPRSQDEQLSDRQAPSVRTTTASDSTNNRMSSNTKGSVETNGVSSRPNSESPLISQDNKPRTPTAPSSAQQVSQVEPKAQPKVRKPAKDPYAIDYNDDDLTNARPAKKKNEESLIDFLRNTEPPSSAAIAQPVVSPSAHRQVTNTVARNTQARARAESPHLTQSGSKLDSYRPTQVTHASHVDRNRNKTKMRNGSQPTQNGNGNTQTMKAFGAGQGSDAADLDNYLKSTRPTSVQAGWTEPLVNKQVNGVRGGEGGGLRKFFSIKRK